MPTPKPQKSARKRKKPLLTAKNADLHDLYQQAVQDTESEAAFLARTFQKVRGRAAVSLKEDFCGTALLCAEWIKKRGRTALGVDLDGDVLAWGKEHNLAPLGEPGERVRLLRQNVLDPCAGRFDVSVALNFSYFVFRTREDMVAYFRNVKRSMVKDGLFFVDLYGGYEAWKPMSESRRCHGFTYVWDQAEVEPLSHSVTNYIHFEFRNGSKVDRAFTYEWRLWTVPELRELLAEAGFGRTTVYWEDGDDAGNGTGRFRPRKRVSQEAAFVVYIVAEP